MPYGSINGVKDNLPKLRKYIKPAADPGFAADLDISEDTVTRVLNEVTDQINAALAQKYTVPFSDPAPAVITGVANDLAAFKIARSYLTTISAEDNQQLSSMRKDAKEILAALVSGDYVIPGQGQAGPASSIEAALEEINMAADEEIFTLEDAAAWQGKL